MKREIEISKANRLINSGNVILVTSRYKEKTNIVTVAWHTPISSKPPAVGIAIAKKHFSAELIKKSGEFVINIPDWELINQVIFCGSHSGRDVDKFKETKLTQVEAREPIKVPKIGECIGSIGCTLIDWKEVGDHYLFIGEVLFAEAEEDIFKDYIWDTSKVRLIYHLGGDCFMKSSASVTVYNR